MRTQELWIDLYAHSGPGSVESWPVWGQWRCLEDGRVHWLVFGFVQSAARGTAQPELVTVGRMRELLEKGSREEVGAVVFPRQVQVGVTAGAGSRANDFGAPPNVDQLVARTVDGLALEERLAIGLSIDPILAGSVDIYPAHELLVPSNDRRLPVAQRTEVCVVQMQQALNRNPRPVIPDWQLVRILEITPADHPHRLSWMSDLQRIPMAEVRSCSGTDQDALKKTLLEYRPHVIVNHVPEALESSLLTATYLVATTLPTEPSPYESLSNLLAQGATSVLVVHDMASRSFARQLISVLCQRGTLTDTLLELHRVRDAYHDVAACGSDLRLRLRQAAGNPVPDVSASATASAWIPLGDRLRGELGETKVQVRMIALSGHVVNATAEVTRLNKGESFRTVGIADASVREQVKNRCSELARSLGHQVDATLTVVGGEVPGLDSGPPVIQACEAAFLAALTGSSTISTAGRFLLVPEDLAERTDGVLLPSYSPVVVRRSASEGYVAEGAVPWTPDPARSWRSWDFRAGTTEDRSFDVVLQEAFWSTLEAAVPRTLTEEKLAEWIAWHEVRLRTHLFPVPHFPIAREFSHRKPLLVTSNRVLWPVEGHYPGPIHTHLVPEVPSGFPGTM